MTQEPEIISSGNPHEVHLPEGSHTAVHKTAVPMEPQIRNTIANPDEEVELVEIVKGVSKSQDEEIRLAHDKAATGPAERSHHEDEPEMADHLVSDLGASESEQQAPALAKPLSQVMDDLPSLDLPASQAAEGLDLAPTGSVPEEFSTTAPTAQEVVASVDTPVVPAVVAAPAQFMEEMNFPARVVNLKMANDQVRGQIEKLEKPLFPPVPVEAPASKKDKEPAKKPAKGH